MVGLKDGHIALRCPLQYGPSFPLGFVPDFTVVLLLDNSTGGCSKQTFDSVRNSLNHFSTKA